MSRVRNFLPQLSGNRLFLTDGGLETDFLFNHGIDLPLFACITLSLVDGEHLPLLRRDYEDYIQLATDSGYGFVLGSANWRASPGWLERLGVPEKEWTPLNKRAIEFLAELRWPSARRTAIRARLHAEPPEESSERTR